MLVWLWLNHSFLCRKADLKFKYGLEIGIHGLSDRGTDCSTRENSFEISALTREYISITSLFFLGEGSSQCLPDSCLSDVMGVYPTQMCIRPIVRFAAHAIHDRPLSVEAHWAGRCVTAVLQKAGIYN